MASLTAQLVVGHPDMYHGGIYPTHVAWLSENSRPAWILQPAGPGHSREPEEGEDPPTWTREEVIWVPSGPEHILEDGLLQLAVHVLRNEELLDLVEQTVPALEDELWVDLTKMPAKALDELRAACVSINVSYKLVVTVFQGSSLYGQLHLLERYPMDVEVCTVSYSRLVPGPWGGDVQIHGSLPPDEGPDGHRYHALNIG